MVAVQSNATSATVRKIVNDLPSAVPPGRAGDAGQRGAADRRRVAGPRSPRLDARWVPWRTEFAAVFAERAQAMTQLRAAVYGFLGMQPIAPPARRPTARPPPAHHLLSATQATNRIAAAGALLTRSDALYRSVRHTLADAAGHGRLPPSAWVTNPQVWQLGSVAAQVDLLATSSSLAASHDVVLRTVRLEPPALPDAARCAGQRLHHQPHDPDHRVGRPGQSGLGRTNRMSRSTSRWPIRPPAPRPPRSGRRARPGRASVTLPDGDLAGQAVHRVCADGPARPPRGPDATDSTEVQQALQVAPGNLSAEQPVSEPGCVDLARPWS